MAHAIETMFSVRQTPWHGLGKVLQNNPSIPEAMVASGLDWDVESCPIYVHNSGGYLAIPEHGKAIRRKSDGSIFGVVGPNYTPLQNSTAFQFFAPFLDAGECRLDTAGSLHGGKIIWVLAELNRQPMEIRKNDSVRKFLLLSNSHDGTRAVKVALTAIRVVCANTLAASDRDNSAASVRIRHTAGVATTLSEVRKTVNLIDREFETTAVRYRELANMGVSVADMSRYFRVLLSNNPENPTHAEESAIADCLNRAMSSTRGNGNGTAWDAYNGFTEYLSYATKHRTPDARIGSLWFGENKQLLATALDSAFSISA